MKFYFTIPDVGTADGIISQARIDAENTRREADEYVVDTLTRLESQLERYLSQVRNGVSALQQVHSADILPETADAESVASEDADGD